MTDSRREKKGRKAERNKKRKNRSNYRQNMVQKRLIVIERKEEKLQEGSSRK